MQNIFIMHDPLAPDDPCAWIAQPSGISVFTNDQGLCWKIIDATGLVTWAEPAFSFDQKWTDDGGTLPEPMPNSGPPPLYCATGPGSNTSGVPRRYHYMIYVVVPGCHDHVRIGMRTDDTPVDPDVWNQPQP